MANYYATARTNSFEVKDIDAFLKALEPLEVDIHRKGEAFILLGSDPDSGCLPHGSTDEEGEWVDLDFPQLVAPHLKDGWVAIFIEAGAEKLRYIHGSAVAVNNKEEYRWINLTDIYGLAKELGDKVTPAEY